MHFFSDISGEKETMSYFAAHFEEQLNLYKKQVSHMTHVYATCMHQSQDSYFKHVAACNLNSDSVCNKNNQNNLNIMTFFYWLLVLKATF